MHFNGGVFHITDNTRPGLHFQGFGNDDRADDGSIADEMGNGHRPFDTRLLAQNQGDAEAPSTAWTQPFTSPSIRSPPVKNRLPSILVPAPIKLSIRPSGFPSLFFSKHRPSTSITEPFA